MNNIISYIKIIKPKIVFANAISIFSGFLLSTDNEINYLLFFTTIIGVSLIIASACVLNNYIDKDIDQIMDRTKLRQLALSSIKSLYCFIYIFILAISGIILLYITTNTICVILSITGYIIYIIIYTLYMKRKSIYAILIGSFSGAIPPIIGYCASSMNYNIKTIIILFLMFSFWQIPHSYAINIFRLKEYQKANIPILPLIKGITFTKINIILFIILFIITNITLLISNFINYKLIFINIIANLYWLITALYGFKKNTNNTEWAKKIFFISLIIINIFNIILLINKINNINLL